MPPKYKLNYFNNVHVQARMQRQFLHDSFFSILKIFNKVLIGQKFFQEDCILPIQLPYIILYPTLPAKKGYLKSLRLDVIHVTQKNQFTSEMMYSVISIKHTVLLKVLVWMDSKDFY